MSSTSCGAQVTCVHSQMGNAVLLEQFVVQPLLLPPVCFPQETPDYISSAYSVTYLLLLLQVMSPLMVLTHCNLINVEDIQVPLFYFETQHSHSPGAFLQCPLLHCVQHTSHYASSPPSLLTPPALHSTLPPSTHIASFSFSSGRAFSLAITCLAQRMKQLSTPS